MSCKLVARGPTKQRLLGGTVVKVSAKVSLGFLHIRRWTGGQTKYYAAHIGLTVRVRKLYC